MPSMPFSSSTACRCPSFRRFGGEDQPSACSRRPLAPGLALCALRLQALLSHPQQLRAPAVSVLSAASQSSSIVGTVMSTPTWRCGCGFGHVPAHPAQNAISALALKRQLGCLQDSVVAQAKLMQTMSERDERYVLKWACGDR